MQGVCYRGEIYYIASVDTFGCEQHGGRPGIIVSNNYNNRFSQTVEIVPLTTRAKKDLPTHVHIESAKYPSTALCEQIMTVDKYRVREYIGRLTPYEEMMLNDALITSLAVQPYTE